MTGRAPALTAAELERPVRRALGEPDARVRTWDVAPVAYDFLNPSSGGVYRVAGTATARGGARPWQLVLKVTRSPAGVEGGPELPLADARRHREAIRWDRELLAYESGFLEQLDGRLVAARCFGGERGPGDVSRLWLEDLTPLQAASWGDAEWTLVARALGELNGRALVAGPPAFDWLGREWLRVWTTLITPNLPGAALPPDGAWQHPLVRSAYPEALRRRLRGVWNARERLLRAVDAVPRTVAHLDAHRRNLFLRREGGEPKVVAIDWGLLGLAAPGEEIAATLVGTLASGERPPDDARDFAELLFASYLAGLQEAGGRGGKDDARLGFAAAAGLRAVSVAGLHAVADGRPDDEAAASLAVAAALVRVLVELGEEAIALAGRQKSTASRTPQGEGP